MKLLIAIFSFMVTVILFSCQKEVSVDTGRGNGTGGTTNDSIVLSKIVTLDTTRPSGLDTVDITLFSYDSQGRLAEMNSNGREDSSSSPVYTYHDINRLYYNGSDTLPYKMTYTSNDFGLAPSKDTVYYKYQQGFVSYDSAIKFLDDPISSFRQTVVQSYSVSGGNVTAHIKQSTIYFSNPPINCEDNYNYVITNSNGNITAESGSISGPCGTGSWDQQITYDDKINPLYRLDIHYRVIIGSNSLFNNAQKNNITSSVSATLNNNIQYYYTYRNDGYPLTVRGKDFIDPSYIRKALFFYTR